MTAPTGAHRTAPNPAAEATSPDLSPPRDPAAYPTPTPAAAPIPKPISVDLARLFTSIRRTSARAAFRSVPPTSSTTASAEIPVTRPVQVRWSERSTRMVCPSRSCSTFAQVAPGCSAPEAFTLNWATSKTIASRPINTSGPDITPRNRRSTACQEGKGPQGPRRPAQPPSAGRVAATLSPSAAQAGDPSGTLVALSRSPNHLTNCLQSGDRSIAYRLYADVRMSRGGGPGCKLPRISCE